MFRDNAKSVVKDMMSYARMQAVAQYMKEFEGRRLAKKREGSSIYLTEDQYLKVIILSTYSI